MDQVSHAKRLIEYGHHDTCSVSERGGGMLGHRDSLDKLYSIHKTDDAVGLQELSLFRTAVTSSAGTRCSTAMFYDHNVIGYVHLHSTFLHVSSRSSFHCLSIL